MAKSRYKVKSRLEHDGKLYEPGATIELADDAAAPLVEIRVIEPAPADEPAKGRK